MKYNVIVILLDIFRQANVIFLINYKDWKKLVTTFSGNPANYLRFEHLVEPVLSCATLA